MSEPLQGGDPAKGGRLAEAIREVKNAAADRDDVVVDFREAQRTRLELLADDLKPVFDDIPADDDRFDLAISTGVQPRLWIDSVAHVTMARDRRTYRFLRDTRLGRVVLAETSNMKAVAEQVTRYIAERLIERQRMLEGDVEDVRRALPAAPATEHTETSPEPAPRRSGAARGVAIVLFGAVAGILLILAFQWEKLVGGTAF